VQEEGPLSTPFHRPLRLSRILRPEGRQALEEVIPLRRILLWVLVWAGITVGIVLYFKYGRLLTPLLG
jgi:hypothetical protein